MIKLKNGIEVEYNSDFDMFFKNVLKAIIHESRKSIQEILVKKTLNNSDSKEPGTLENETLLKEIMDNCIYVTHQLFEMSKENKDLSKFIVTGFIFNSIILTISQSDMTLLDSDLDDNDDDEIIH